MPTNDHHFQAMIPISLPYCIYLPDGYIQDGDAHVSDKSQFPLIICLHGAGERGSDISMVKRNGLPGKLERGDKLIADTQPFIVAAPQCPRNLDWSMILSALDLFVQHVLDHYHVDPDRVYLTGLSMGGFGTWALATECPSRFAAIAPICGGGRHLIDFPERLQRIIHLPVWNFHGDMDVEIPLEQSTKLVRALRRYGGNVRSTVYPGVGHDSWTQTYDNPELYWWFLQHKRQKPLEQNLSEIASIP